MKRFFSSDWHLGHKNISGPKMSNWPNGYRTFDSPQEMDEDIIKNVNNMIQYHDHLFYLGDFSLGAKVQEYRDRINCRQITFILGNHDDPRNIERVFGIMNTHHVLEIKEKGVHYFLSHYAHRVWNKSHRDSIHLYGHSHDSLDREGEEWGRSMDVSVDSAYRLFGEYRPFTEDEILRIMSKRESKFVDHHGKARV